LPDIRASLKRAQVRIDFPAPAAVAGLVRPELVPGEKAEPAKSRREAGRKAAKTAKVMADATLESLIAFGVIKPPFDLERDYKGSQLTAVVEQSGKVMFAGKAYDSLSTAGGVARKQVIGAPPDRPHPQTNGWTFWQYRDEKGDLHELQVLRKSYLERAQGRQRT
jgi:hypothetical protein